MESVSKTVRKLSLTSELVALYHRDVIDPGPEAKYDYIVDADYEKAVERWLRDEVAPAYYRMKSDSKRGVSAGKVLSDIRARHASRSKAKA
jgi:hypothetical protein